MQEYLVLLSLNLQENKDWKHWGSLRSEDWDFIGQVQQELILILGKILEWIILEHVSECDKVVVLGNSTDLLSY